MEDDPDSAGEETSEGEEQDVDGDEDGDRSPDETKGDTNTQDTDSQIESIEEGSSADDGGEDEKSESQTQGSDQSGKRNQPTVDDVPEGYWDEIEEQTGGLYTKSNVDSLERVKQLLTESKREQLEEELS